MIKRNPGALPCDDRRYVALLQRYDEELRRGTVSRSTCDEGPHETPPAAGNVLDCLHLLERVWPRARRSSGPTIPVEQIGRFRIERVLGHGGFGIVYLAVDPALGRQVALKVPRFHALSQPALVERFRREARAAAALDHPHIIPVFEAGEAADSLYIASAYCPGPNLGQWLKECSGGISPAVAARMLAQLADAVAYSHSRGVLHRDIKPGNVLLVPSEDRAGAPQGRVDPADRERTSYHPTPSKSGQNPSYIPRLGDFGLAKVLEEAAADGTLHLAEETAVGVTLGTPAYMAPEQTAGGTESIGPAADIYALGAVLYELLTGRPPFQGSSVVDLLDQVRHAEPVPVRRLRRDVPRDLETICHKCLEKVSSRRYATGDELYADLERFQRGEPIRARPPGVAKLGWKAMRRRPAVTALIVLTALALGAFGFQRSLSSAALRKVNTDLERTNTQLEEALATAQRSERAARGIAYALDIKVAWRARGAGDFIEFSRIVDRYRDGTELARYRGPEWQYLERMTRTSQRTWLELPTPIYDIVSGPTGQVALVGKDAVVRLIGTRTGAVGASWPTGQVEVNSACFMPDGRFLWTAGDDGTIREWDVATGDELRRIDIPGAAKVFKVQYLPQQNQLLSCGTEGPIRLWDLQKTVAPAGTLDGHTDWVQDVVLLSDGRKAISASDDETLRMWDLDSKRELWRYREGDWKFRDLAVSPDGRHFAACGRELRIFNTESLAVEQVVAFADDARLACFGSDSGRIYVADRLGAIHTIGLDRDDAGRIVEAKSLAHWRAHKSGVHAVRRSADNRSILTAGKDGLVAEWSEPGEAARPITITDPGIVLSVAIEPASRWLVVGSKRRLSIHDLRESDAPPTVLADFGDWSALDVDPGGTMIAAGDGVGGVCLWSPTGTRLRTIVAADQTAHPGNPVPKVEITSLCFDRNGRALAVADKNSRDIIVFDPHTGARLHQFPVGSVRDAQLSPTEDLLAASTGEHHIVLWHWPSGTALWQSERFPERPGWIKFSSDGQRILAETGDRTVRVFDRHSGKVVRELGQHRAEIHCIAISPDGRTIATKGGEEWLNLWHAESGQLLFTLPAESGGSETIAFSADGAWLVYRAKLNEVHLLPMQP